MKLKTAEKNFFKAIDIDNKDEIKWLTIYSLPLDFRSASSG